jgi:outer membrane protein TolC
MARAALIALLMSPAGFAQDQTQTPPPPPPQTAPANPAQTAPPNPQPAPEAPAPANQQPSPTLQQQIQQQQQQTIAEPKPFYVSMPHSHNPLSAYEPATAPQLDLRNSPRLQNLIREGKLYISLQDAIALAIENNLDLASFRYNFPIAQTDLLRTRAGGQVRGVNTAVVQSTQGGFGGGTSGGGGSAGGSAAAGAGGIVQSTLGAGTAVASFDPYLNFKGFDDHNVVQEVNPSQVGVPIFRLNTIQGQAQFAQSFPVGTDLTVNYLGNRQTANSPYFATNPTLSSSFQVVIAQQLLAGFGLSTNERYIRIAKRNMQITDLAFRLQVIATVTQVENIYWDLVNAYEDEQIKEQSLNFANQTLADDQRQLGLKAIPAIQVMKDQAAVAGAEGDLTVSRATLRLNELTMKNLLTKTDDPTIDELPVIPLDRIGASDPNAGKSIDDLITEAEKNRPDVREEQIAMEVAQMSLKSINSELLPVFNMYGLYQGSGVAGVKNPNCILGPRQCSSNLPTGFGGMLDNTFNYTAPEYQVGVNLSINLRNRVAKADQFRAVLEYRQRQITFEEQRKSIRFDVRNSKFAVEQAQARVDAAQKARDLAQRTFEITQQEQKLGAKSSLDTLAAQNALAVSESALDAAQTNYEKAKVDIDRATGETLERTGVSIDDAKSGVVTHGP